MLRLSSRWWVIIASRSVIAVRLKLRFQWASSSSSSSRRRASGSVEGDAQHGGITGQAVGRVQRNAPCTAGRGIDHTLHTVRLLLVEDDAMIGEAIRAGLKREGFTVDWVHDARAAESVLRSEPFELLLLDLGLPGRDGLALLRAERERGLHAPGADHHRARRGLRPRAGAGRRRR